MSDLTEKVENLRKLAQERKSDIQKRPRHYAEEIVKLKSREERKSALEKIPDEFKAMVKTHVEVYFLRKKSK